MTSRIEQIEGEQIVINCTEIESELILLLRNRQFSDFQ